MGAEVRGIRSWVLADLALTLGRISTVCTIPGVADAVDPELPAITGALYLPGPSGHLVALRRVAGHRDHPPLSAAAAVAAALLCDLLGSHTGLLPHRRRWMSLTLMANAASAASAPLALRPLLRFCGASAALLGRPADRCHDGLGDRRADRERLCARIERLVVTDLLTGSLNRHGLVSQLSRAIAHRLRSGRPMSVLMFDLDHVKRVNDLHGDAVGDQVPAGFAARVGDHLRAHLRASDALARWSGEAFLLLLPNTPLAGAWTQAKRLHELVGRAAVADGVPRITVSGGVAPVTAHAAGSDHSQTLLQ